MEDYTCRPMSSSILTPSLVAISGLEGESGAVSIRSYAKKICLSQNLSKNLCHSCLQNKEAEINNTKPFPINWIGLKLLSNWNSPLEWSVSLLLTHFQWQGVCPRSVCPVQAERIKALFGFILYYYWREFILIYLYEVINWPLADQESAQVSVGHSTHTL